MAGRFITSDRGRRTVYHVAAAALAVAGIWGLVTAEEAENYIQALVLLLGAPVSELAATNTPKPDKPKPDLHDPVEDGGSW